MYADIALSKGSAEVAGFNLSKMKRRNIATLRRTLGIVFQDFQLLQDRNVSQNLTFVMRATAWRKKKEIKKRTLNVLQKVGLQQCIHKMPHELSGGEQQRLAIARALINNPKLILADEPTGNLDPETSEGIMQLLNEIVAQGTTVIMATHDMNMLEKFPGKIYRCFESALKEIKPKTDFDPFKSMEF